MIGGGAFLLLKTSANGLESSKQAEIRLAGSATILAFGSQAGPQVPVAQTPRRAGKCIQWLDQFRIPMNMANGQILRFCYSDHSISRESGAVSCKGMQ
jgi:hypothetical protein